MGILIGEKKYRNQGFSLIALLQGMTFLNKNYNIRYFWLGVNKKNIPAIHLYKRQALELLKKKTRLYDVEGFSTFEFKQVIFRHSLFGMKYGINNRFGKIKIHEAKNILNYCEKLGIRSIDSAISYGDAEKILGKIELKILRLPQNYLLLRLRKLKI